MSKQTPTYATLHTLYNSTKSDTYIKILNTKQCEHILNGALHIVRLLCDRYTPLHYICLSAERGNVQKSGCSITSLIRKQKGDVRKEHVPQATRN